MAIRFRCPHCRQLLGISVAQIGQVVDCPTCGRSIRVPQRSGKAKAVTAKPKLDLEDDALSAALDELVALGQSDGQLANHPSTPEPIERTTVSVAPASVSLPPLPPVEVTEVPLQAAAIIASPIELSVADEPAADFTSELEQLAQVAPVDISEFDPPPKRIWFLPTIAALLVGFGAGYVARIWETDFVRAQTYENQKPEFQLDGIAAANDRIGHESALQGRVMYVSGTGETRPDIGARVILLPMKRATSQKISESGVRAGDSARDQMLAAKALRKQGGEITVVKDDGSFSVNLAAPGEYHVLVLSHYQRREDTRIPSSDRQVIDDWFERGTSVLGRVDYVLSKLNYSGQGTESRDFEFERL